MPTVDMLAAYCEEVGAPDVIRQRVEALIILGEAFSGSRVRSLVIEDTLNPDGVRQFSNVHGFLENECVIDLPIPEPNWMPAILKITTVAHIRVRRCENFDFVHTTQNSQFEAEIGVSAAPGLFSAISVVLNGTGRNCSHIVQAMRQFYYPMLSRR